jgi:predicted amino acid-binding ACT domain protein
MKNDFEIPTLEHLNLHGMLGLHYEVSRFGASETIDSILSDFRSNAISYGLIVTLENLEEKDGTDGSDESTFVLTHFGGAGLTYEVSKIAEEEDVAIESISNQSHHGVGSTVMTLRSKNDVSHLKQRVMSMSRELNHDLTLQSDEAFRKNKRLAFFDMEIIDEIAKAKIGKKSLTHLFHLLDITESDYEETLSCGVL